VLDEEEQERERGKQTLYSETLAELAVHVILKSLTPDETAKQ
jgi:hypothetical protein